MTLFEMSMNNKNKLINKVSNKLAKKMKKYIKKKILKGELECDLSIENINVGRFKSDIEDEIYVKAKNILINCYGDQVTIEIDNYGHCNYVKKLKVTINKI